MSPGGRADPCSHLTAAQCRAGQAGRAGPAGSHATLAVESRKLLQAATQLLTMLLQLGAALRLAGSHVSGQVGWVTRKSVPLPAHSSRLLAG